MRIVSDRQIEKSLRTVNLFLSGFSKRPKWRYTEYLAVTTAIGIIRRFHTAGRVG